MREFAFGATNQTVAGATTLNALKPAAAPNVNIEFLRHWVGQTANATSAQQRIEFAQQAVAGSPALTSVTPAKLKLQDPNASVIVGGTSLAAGTAGTNASTESTGTSTTIWDDAFNVLNGYLKILTPPELEDFPAGFANISRLWFPTAPATLTGWTFGQNFREV
jgi:hypothetical protein